LGYDGHRILSAPACRLLRPKSLSSAVPFDGLARIEGVRMPRNFVATNALELSERLPHKAFTFWSLPFLREPSMKETVNESSTTNLQPQPSLKFIDMPVVLLGEDSAEYAQLRQQIEDYVRPLDIIEKMYVSDLAYYS
jgi:hypothetical protein